MLRVGALVLLAGVVSVVSARGQAPVAAPGAGEASGFAQVVKRDYRFEVASIRPVGPPTGYEYRAGPEGYSPGRYRELNISLASLAWEAFRVKHDYSIENQRWMDSTYFTVNATLPDGATKADIPIMIRHLLEDRFGMKYHRETREMGGYELIVVPSGSKLTNADTKPKKNRHWTDLCLMQAWPSSKARYHMKDGVPHFDDSVGSLALYGSPYGALWRRAGTNTTDEETPRQT